MTNPQAQVSHWMENFQQQVPRKPALPSTDVLRLRANLIKEEAVKETVEALEAAAVGNGNMIEIADGLADSLFVILGTASALGLDIWPVFNEVVRSNWTKLWSAAEVTEKTHDDKWMAEHRTFRVDGKFLVKRKSDSKIVKSPSYSPANIKPIIEAQMKDP